MPYLDANRARENQRERGRRYRRRLKTQKYGETNADVDMRGRHGNHAHGERSGRWNAGRLATSHGYVAVRVPLDHPHAWGSTRLKRFKYAYEHVLVMAEHIGRPLHENEVVHHRNGNRTDNRLENLELTTASEHQRYHTTHTRGRDAIGRLLPVADLRVREFPV